MHAVWQGTLHAGDCQWMTAASGIEHDEGRGAQRHTAHCSLFTSDTPSLSDHPGGVLHGFQMWINLPSAHKMDPPAYQDVPARAIPLIDAAAGVKAKIIAGCVAC